MTHPVPVVDLQVATRSTAPAHLIESVKAAVETTGAIQVINHGVPQHLINDFSHRTERLFNLPRTRKARLAGLAGQPGQRGADRGWRREADDFGRLEVERFGVGQYDNVAHARAAGVAPEHLSLYANENVWPDDDSRLHFTAFRYMDSAREVAERVLGLYARTQGLPAGTFPAGADEQAHLSLTVSQYPAWSYADTNRAEDRLLLTDRAFDSAVTVLTQEGEGAGLQILGRNGEWADVPAVPGALLVFSGAVLTWWTNGRLRPARHRVVAGSTVPRRSAAVSYYPALDAVLRPLPVFGGSGFGGTGFSDTGFGHEPVTTWDLLHGGASDWRPVLAS